MQSYNVYAYLFSHKALSLRAVYHVVNLSVRK